MILQLGRRPQRITSHLKVLYRSEASEQVLACGCWVVLGRTVRRNPPYAYMKDVLSRLSTERASQVGELLPHRWQPTLTIA